VTSVRKTNAQHPKNTKVAIQTTKMRLNSPKKVGKMAS
jgi:hypothetical protein